MAGSGSGCRSVSKSGRPQPVSSGCGGLAGEHLRMAGSHRPLDCGHRPLTGMKLAIPTWFANTLGGRLPGFPQGRDGSPEVPAAGVSLIRRTLVNKRSNRAPATTNSLTKTITNELANAAPVGGVLLCGSMVALPEPVPLRHKAKASDWPLAWCCRLGIQPVSARCPLPGAVRRRQHA